MYRAPNRPPRAVALRQPFGDVLDLFLLSEIATVAENGYVRLNLDDGAGGRARGYVNVTETSGLAFTLRRSSYSGSGIA